MKEPRLGTQMGDTGNKVFLRIQNTNKPDQIISLVINDSASHFETLGLRDLFGLDEIWIDRREFLTSMEEYASVLSFLFATISEAQDLNLPYGYIQDFEYDGRQYSLTGENGHMVLAAR